MSTGERTDRVQYRIQDCQGGSRNIKYKAPQVAAIFFMTSFNRERGAIVPLAPSSWIRSWGGRGVGEAGVLVFHPNFAIQIFLADATPIRDVSKISLAHPP